MSELNFLIENHLNLQAEISYQDHHQFLVRYGLNQCENVLDIGTGSGYFLKKLAHDHPNLHFVGIDKRIHLFESTNREKFKNIQTFQVDMFSKNTTFDFSKYDGILMRYFLLHVDHSQKILDLFINKAKRPSKFWIIDLDWSKIECIPKHPSFEYFLNPIKNFCQTISKDSQGGRNIHSMLLNSGFQDVRIESVPFHSKNTSLLDFSLYLKQEIICYSMLMGKSLKDSEVINALSFINNYVETNEVEVFYGMNLVFASIK